MISGIVEGGAALLIGIFGGIYIIGQIKENSKKNEEDINDIKMMMAKYQETMQNMLAKAMSDLKTLIDSNKEYGRESLQREITHIKDLLNASSTETREDIKRLEAAQLASNRVKERLAIAENSLRSLHHRLDIDPSLIKNDLE